MNPNFYSRQAAASATLFVLVLASISGAAFAQGVTSNSFNPALSVIVDGKYAHYSRDETGYSASGFLLSDGADLAPRGFSLGESEVVASANVDDKFYGQLTLSIEALDEETTLQVEEAFVQTTALPNGLTAKAGRFFSDIGYLNSKHAHSWDFVDQPLVYKALLGGQYGDDGVHVHWVAPSDLLVEIGGEAFRGAAYPAAGATHGGVGSWSSFAHIGGDIGNTQSWRGGVSYLNTDAEERVSTDEFGGSTTFTGSSDVWIADMVWKWSARGNPKSRNWILQGEYLHRSERGMLQRSTLSSSFEGTQQGFYLQSVYQFIPRWRVGLRFDRLSAANNGTNLSIAPILSDGHDPARVTAMIDFSNSEFSRFRLQLAEDRSRPQRDMQITLQYLMSIGAHGAHQF